MSVNDDVVKLPSTKEKTKTETIPLFELDGKTYEIPANPRAGVSLKYLQISTTEGSDAASYYILTEMLGEEAFNVLADHPSLTKEQFEAVFKRVEETVLGDGSGNP